MAAHIADERGGYSVNGDFGGGEAAPLLPPSGVRPRSVSFNSSATERKSGLSSFEGVFVPCVLSIFSVVLFLRLGYIVGQSGLIVCLAMLVVSYTVVFLTILSISGIATNGLVRGGGAYYMISRSLGPEFGGAIGIIFYFANIFSSGLYIVGFVEALNHNVPPLPSGQWYLFGCGSGVLLFCLVVCLIGAKAFAKTSMLIFAAVMIAVMSVILNFAYAKENDNMGCPQDVLDGPGNVTCPGNLAYTRFSTSTLSGNLDTAWSIDYTTDEMQSLRTVFAVLFNGCTGIMAGANISGDLKDASTAIPYGTMAASCVTFIVYILLFVLSAGSCNRNLLLYNYSYLSDINVVPPMVIIGIFCATLSAALSCLIGASRIIQAISRDRLLGDWFTIFSSEEGEPTRAVLLSWLLVQMVLFIGQINVIAPIVSMLYLISYAITNFACFALSVTGAPNFRPTFRYFSWHTALLGFVGCMFVMFYVNPTYAGVTVALAVVLWVWIHVRHIPVEWGDVSQALMYHQVRKYLLLMRPDAALGKYWRPQILFLSTNPRYNFEALRHVNEQKKGGLLILGHVIVGDIAGAQGRHNQAVSAVLDLARCARLKMFAEITIAKTIRRGAQQLLLCSGLGTMRPNTVFVGFYSDNEREDQLLPYRSRLKQLHKSMFGRAATKREFDEMCAQFPVTNGDFGTEENPHMSPEDYVGVLRDALRYEKSIGVLRNMRSVSNRLNNAKRQPETFYIDIWPLTSSHLQSYELLLQLAQILRSTRRWKSSTKLRVFSICTARVAEADKVATEKVLKSLRIRADIVQVISDSGDYDADRLQPQRLEELDLDTCVELNRVMRQQTNSCLVYSYLPEPPEKPSDARAYIAQLSALTDNLPPVTLVRGAEFVATHHSDAV